MSMIMPAGKNGYNWSPKYTKENGALVRTASTGKEEEAEKDALYAAASKFVKAQMVSTPACEPCEEKVLDEMGGTPSVEEVVEVGVEGADAAGAAAQKAVSDLIEKANGADQVKEEVKNAVANAEDAIEELKSIVSDGGDEEVEFEIGEISDSSEDCKEGEDCDKPESEEESGGEDIIVESDESGESEESEESEEDADEPEEDEGSVTASRDTFVKMSKVSPETKRKVYDFWVNQLKYPKEYVALMTKDYEK